MSPEHRVLRDHVVFALERCPDFGRRLFEHPDLASAASCDCLGEDRSRCEDNALMLLLTLLDRLDHPGFDVALERVGARFASKGVPETLYATLARVLLDTLAEVLADRWTAALEACYARALARVVAALVRGSRPRAVTPVLVSPLASSLYPTPASRRAA